MMDDINNTLPWLQSSWAQLIQYRVQNRVPQALIISGNKGLGKKQLAQQYVYALLCPTPLENGEPCGQCQSCQLFHAETHPDFTKIEPAESGKVIGIDVIRQLITKLTLKPQFDGFRVVLIHQAEMLNTASANAFLKYLEEPTERTCIVLVTEKPYKLPATILSRCQQMHVPTPNQTVLHDWLRQQDISENIELLSVLLQNAPLMAKQFLEQDLLALRTSCFESWIKMTCSNSNFVELAEQWYKLEREEIGFLLEWITSWVADLLKIAHHCHKISLYNPDFSKDLQELAQRLNLIEVFKYYDFLLSCQQQLDTQLNKQLMFEEILIRWSQLRNVHGIN